jgi:NADH dehydrogenase/NADH:ubiquinone oxidoreductase subunit G
MTGIEIDGTETHVEPGTTMLEAVRSLGDDVLR